MIHKDLAASNVILAASAFNPSVLSEVFLVRNKILAEEDVQPGFVFSDQLVLVRTRAFTLMVTPPQLQFAATEAARTGEFAPAVVEIVKQLPHTPVTAAGLNLVWMLRVDDESFTELNRRLFFTTSSLSHLFDVPDARFGAYMSRSVEGFRCRLDMKPTRIPGATGEERIAFSFNFHTDVAAGAAPERVSELVGAWDRLFSFSADVVSKVAP